MSGYGAADRPLKIGDTEIPCYVLADGTRVLAQRGLQGGIGLSLGGGKSGARRIPVLMEGLAEKGIDVRGLVVRKHDCTATLVESMSVKEEFQGKLVWQGVVHVFDLEGHPNATRAYAWSSPIEGSTKRRFYAVLEIPPVQSALDAVRAAIVAENRGGHNGDL